MAWMYCADFHLTSRPKDSYRWSVFPWLKRQCVNRELEAVFILGDLTDRKDEHPAVLVDRLVNEIKALAACVTRKVFILKGNHDYRDEKIPFFKFLGDCCGEKVEFLHEDKTFKLGGLTFLALPHTRDFAKYTARYLPWKFDRILFHQAIKGAMTESGRPLDQGIHVDRHVRDWKCAIGGDVHVPQKVFKPHYCIGTHYVGAPHPIRFGDDFKPRVMIDDGEKIFSVERTTIKKSVLKVTDHDALIAGVGTLTKGDMARIEIVLPRNRLDEWENLRQWSRYLCKRRGIRLHGIRLEAAPERHLLPQAGLGTARTPLETFRAYARDRGLDSAVIALGEKLLREEA